MPAAVCRSAPRRRSRLSEPRTRIRLLSGPTKGFQGDPAAPLAIERLVDDAERAGSEPASQPETLRARKVFRPEAAHQSSPLRTEILSSVERILTPGALDPRHPGFHRII